MISTRSAGLLIDTVVCLTLAKWETVSGRFGGYLNDNLGIDKLSWYQKAAPELDLFIASDAQGNFDSEFDSRLAFIVGRNVRASDLLMTRVSSMQIERLAAAGQTPRFVRIGIKTEIDD